MYLPLQKYQRGQFLILVAFSVVVLIGFTGLAIDSGRGYGVKAKLNAAVDAAAIAAGRALATGNTDQDRIDAATAAATNYYNANFPDGYLGATRSNPAISAVHDANSGRWTVDVSGTATMPVTFTGILGFTNVPVVASGRTIRRDLDIVLVLDISGSIGGAFNQLIAAARDNFVKKLIPSSDRLGLVAFSSGAINSVNINTSARGFDQTNAVNVLNALSLQQYTGSTEGMRLALNQLNNVTAANRSSLRMIVFFSDGAPNMVPAKFCDGAVDGGGSCTGSLRQGDLFSETNGSESIKADTIYRNNFLNTSLPPGTFSNIATLPNTGLSMVVANGSSLGINLASDLSSRNLAAAAAVTFNYPYRNSRCNVNRAARNMVENVANEARKEGVKIFSIGLGAELNAIEVSGCSYSNLEQGQVIMKRIANTSGTAVTAANPGNPGSDTFQALPQPSGLYVAAADGAALAAAFSTILSEILRLTQ